MMREKDRERQRLKRLNPEYREMERQRDKIRRAERAAQAFKLFHFFLNYMKKA